MRIRSLRATVLSLVVLAVTGCSNASEPDADISSAEVTTSSIVGNRYVVTGEFVKKQGGTTTVVGDGFVELRITRTFKENVAGFLQPWDTFAADVRVGYPAGNGTVVAAGSDVAFKNDPRGYGPPPSIATVDHVSLAVIIEGINNRRILGDFTEVNVQGTAMTFLPKGSFGPF